ncbi:aspartic peptidase domain-containing protein [Scheffersomyces amazonensis]|uniref:aspartic peptidase domain-containing protein n=1 Tax=Scheffersomyces amazonensis TaxID=1078765 RepID=UPI00315DF7D4
MKVIGIIASALYYASITSALWPVKDFRVNDINELSKLSITPKKKISIGYKDQTVLSNNDNQDNKNAPIIELGNDVQMLLTDVDNSIYYLLTTIVDTSTNYEEQFSLLLDTGSAVSWLYNQSCIQNGCNKPNINKFDDYSKPLKMGTTFELLYTGEEVSGNTLSLIDNGLDIIFGNDLTFGNISIGITNDSPEMFDGYNISGLLSSADSRNLVRQFYVDQVIDQQVFSLFLISNDQNYNINTTTDNLPDGFGGLIIFGSKALDLQSNFTNSAEIHYTNLLPNDNSYWLINISNIQISDSYNQISNFNSSTFSTQREAIIDTGTTGMVFPVDDANIIHQQLFNGNYITDNQGNYAFPCNASSSAEIIFTIGNSQLNLSASNFMGEPYTTASLEGYCASKIQGINDYQYWVLGAAFLNKFYTIFDLSNQQLGFAQLSIDSFKIENPSPIQIQSQSETQSESETQSDSTTSSIPSTLTTSKSTHLSSTSTSASNSSNSSSDRKGNGAFKYESFIPLHMLLAALIICIIL